MQIIESRAQWTPGMSSFSIVISIVDLVFLAKKEWLKFSKIMNI